MTRDTITAATARRVRDNPGYPTGEVEITLNGDARALVGCSALDQFGTPPGVGSGMKPPQWLVPWDVVELRTDGSGQERQTVVRI